MVLLLIIIGAFMIYFGIKKISKTGNSKPISQESIETLGVKGFKLYLKFMMIAVGAGLILIGLIVAAL